MFSYTVDRSLVYLNVKVYLKLESYSSMQQNLGEI